MYGTPPQARSGGCEHDLLVELARAPAGAAVHMAQALVADAQARARRGSSRRARGNRRRRARRRRRVRGTGARSRRRPSCRPRRRRSPRGPSPARARRSPRRGARRARAARRRSGAARGSRSGPGRRRGDETVEAQAVVGAAGVGVEHRPRGRRPAARRTRAPAGSCRACSGAGTWRPPPSARRCGECLRHWYGPVWGARGKSSSKCVVSRADAGGAAEHHARRSACSGSAADRVAVAQQLRQRVRVRTRRAGSRRRGTPPGSPAAPSAAWSTASRSRSTAAGS